MNVEFPREAGAKVNPRTVRRHPTAPAISVCTAFGPLRERVILTRSRERRFALRNRIADLAALGREVAHSGATLE